MLGVEGTMSGTRIVGTASATRRREVTISLPHSGWTDGEQTVAVSGRTAEATVQWEPDRDLTATAVIRT